MNEAHYQWHSITAGRFILVHTTKPLYSWKKGSAKPVHSVPIWILKRCYEYFMYLLVILIIFFSYTLTLILRIYIHWKTIWMYQKYHNNNNSKCVTFLTHYNDFPSYTLEKYIKRLQILERAKKYIRYIPWWSL